MCLFTDASKSAMVLKEKIYGVWRRQCSSEHCVVDRKLNEMMTRRKQTVWFVNQGGEDPDPDCLLVPNIYRMQFWISSVNVSVSLNLHPLQCRTVSAAPKEPSQYLTAHPHLAPRSHRCKVLGVTTHLCPLVHDGHPLPKSVPHFLCRLGAIFPLDHSAAFSPFAWV